MVSVWVLNGWSRLWHGSAVRVSGGGVSAGECYHWLIKVYAAPSHEFVLRERKFVEVNELTIKTE